MEYSPYIQAIQKLGGYTPGEKYQELNRIASKIVLKCMDLNSPITVSASVYLHEPLIPLVQLEVARFIKNQDVIASFLKSNDPMVFNRAIKVKWFFSGRIEKCTSVFNAKYFEDHIFPAICLNHRVKLIRTLAKSLAHRENRIIAGEFYFTIMKLYGEQQARPLLKCCSESLIWDIIEHKKIVLKIKEVNFIFLQYPNLIIKYLKLGKMADDTQTRLLYEKSFKNYENFLPKLLKNHSDAFVEIIEMYIVSIRLSENHTNLFLKNKTEILIKNPKVFIDVLSLRRVTKKLTRSQFKELYKNLFPENQENFAYSTIYDYLEYLPINERLPLFLSTYEEVYGKNLLLDCSDLISVDMLKYLPRDERINQARKKIESDKSWYINVRSCSQSVRCYLPVEESISFIKEQMLKSVELKERINLMEELIYTCVINEDNNALLKVFEFVLSYFQDVKDNALVLGFFNVLWKRYNFKLLSLEHWKLLNKFLKLLSSLSSLNNNEDIWHVICSSIEFDLQHERSITSKMNLLIRLNKLSTNKMSWNMIVEIPGHEQVCLDKLLTLLPACYIKDRKENSRNWQITVISFMKTIYEFNEKLNVEKISITNYPWILECVKKSIEDQNDNKKIVKELKFLLKCNEPDLYVNFMLNSENVCNKHDVNDALIQLKDNPENILNDYQTLYNCFKNDIKCANVRKFFKSTRWYHDIPIKFLEAAHKDIVDNHQVSAIAIVAMIIDGPSFQQYINTIRPDQSDQKIMSDHDVGMLKAINDFIMSHIKVVDPPISLDFIESCDQIRVVSRLQVYFKKTIPADNLSFFYHEQIRSNNPTSLVYCDCFCQIACIAQLREAFEKYENKDYKSVRLTMLCSLVKSIMKNPCMYLREVIDEAMINLTDDFDVVMQNIKTRNTAPDASNVKFLKSLLLNCKRILQIERDSHKNSIPDYAKKILRHFPFVIPGLLPDELNEIVIELYSDNSLTSIIMSVPVECLINYILTADKKLDERLVVFSKIFQNYIKFNCTNSNCEENFTLFPIEYFLNELINKIIFNTSSRAKLINVIHKNFLSVMKPHEMPEFHCFFTIAGLYNNEKKSIEFVNKIKNILLSLIENFSSEFMFLISKLLYKLIKCYFKDYDDEHLAIIEHLLTFNNKNINTLASHLLQFQPASTDKRVLTIIRTLRKRKCPIAISYIHKIHKIN